MRSWRKSVAAGAIAALLLGVPLLTLRAGEDTITSVVYLEGGVDTDRSRLVVEPLWSADGDVSDERVVYPIDHERGFLPRGSLSPDGRTAALIRQPRGRPEREAAQAMLVDLDGSGAMTALSVPAFGPSTPIFSTSGPRRIFITAASLASAPPPSDDEMRAGRLRPYDFTVWEVDRDGLGASKRIEQRLTWLHTIGIGLVRFGVANGPVPSLLMYRITHAGADIAAMSLVSPDGPTNIANLGFTMARDFDVSVDGDALMFLAQDPGQATARIESLFLAQGGPPVQLGGQVSRDASPEWARTFREWFLVRRPGRVGREDPPMRLHRAGALAPAGQPLDSLTNLTGVAEGPEFPLEHGASPDGRFVAVRSDPGPGPIFFLRDTADPQAARPLGEGGLIRILGVQMKGLGGRSVLVLVIALAVPVTVRAQDTCDQELHCGIAPIQGPQPCALDLRLNILDPAANNALGVQAPELPPIRRGCGAGVLVPGRAPCQLLRAFAFAKSRFRQFCTSSCGENNEGSTGPTRFGALCGVGVTQVPADELPEDVDPVRVAASTTYNAGAGVRRLADAWGRTPCVGNANPDVAEHWYFAVWAADAFTYLNNPNNPAYPVQRGIYGDTGGFDRDSYPFQEVVFGLAGHPPIDDDGFAVWAPSVVNLPSTIDVCGTAGCVPNNIPSPAQTHDRDCPPFLPPLTDAGPPDAGDEADAGVDASSDAGNLVPTFRKSDCTCSAPGSSAPSSPVLVLPLLALVAARIRSGLARRSRACRSSTRSGRR